MLSAFGQPATATAPVGLLSPALALVVGLAIVALTLYDLFHSILMPRPSVARVHVSPILTRQAWRLWRALPSRLDSRRREPLLAAFGPAILIALLGLWVSGLVFGYALVLDGVSGPAGRLGLGSALWLSTESFFTLGYGALAPVGAWARVAAALEAATGLGTMAMAVSLLFSLFQAFQRREALVVDLDASAGAPPSGVQILETCAQPGMDGHLADLMRDWRRWSADVLESHLAYPVLPFFRSSHDREGSNCWRITSTFIVVGPR